MSGQAIKTINRKRVWYAFAAIAVVVVIAGLISWPGKIPVFIPGSSFFNNFSNHLGLDLQGGTHLVYEADVANLANSDRTDALNGVRDVIERRVNAYGVSEPLVQTSHQGNTYRVIVELAGVQDVNQAIKLIGETPLLEFKELAPSGTAATQSGTQEFENRALAVLSDALRGVDFAKLVAQYSDDVVSKAKGGDMGFINAQSTNVPLEYKNAVLGTNIPVGTVYPNLIKSSLGYHIIKITGTRGSTFDREVQTSQILIEVPSDNSGSGPQWVNTALTGKNLKRSQVEFDPNTGQPQVALTFDDQGKMLFAEITQRNIGKPVAIFLDGAPISTPTVQNAITEGRAVITGSFSVSEAKTLAQRLNAGALPVPINLITQQTVGPTLGKDSVEKSLIAGILGLLAVALFMLIYYRLPGLVAVIALLVYTTISMAIFKVWPVTLTLAGIAGFILSIGMAVDANVLIFERLREEMRNGKPLGQAVEDSFSRAWLAIRDSNVSSLITCIILAWFGTGIVKGFAITLAIGIAVSMFTAITLTRTLLRLVIGGRLKIKNWLIGL